MTDAPILIPMPALKCFAVLSEGQKMEGWVCEFPGKPGHPALWCAADIEGRIMAGDSKDEAAALLLEGLGEALTLLLEGLNDWG